MIFGDNFLFGDRDESCTGKLAPISSKGPKFVAQTDFFFVYTDEEFAINGI